MSYEKVKNIKIDEKQGKVFFTTASNNVRPLTYYNSESAFYSNLLKEKGKQEVEIAILKEYEEGNLQGGTNKYSKALKVLHFVYSEEYKNFHWRFNPYKYNEDKENYQKYETERDLKRNSEEFKQLLLKCLNYKFSKTKYVITKMYGSDKIFGKRTLKAMKWLWDKEKATKYDFKEEAEHNIFSNFKDQWKVEEIGGLKNE